MKLIYLLFTIPLMGVCAMPSNAQSTFKIGLTQSTLNSDMGIICNGVVEGKNANIYTIGYRWNNTTNKRLTFLSALNPSGDLLWSKQYVANGGIEFNEIWEAPDGNLLVSIALPKVVFGGQNYGSGFAKINKDNGSIIWSSLLDSNSEGVTQTPTLGSFKYGTQALVRKNNTNDGFTMTGMKIKATGGQVQKYNYCIHTDANGQRLTGPTHNKYFEPATTSLDFVQMMLDKDDNCYSLANFGSKTFRIAKVPNNATQPEWLKAYSFIDVNQVEISNMIDVGGGKILMVGFGWKLFSPNINSNQVGLLVLMNSDGEIEWSNEYNTNGPTTFNNNIFYKVLQTSDGFILIDFYGLIVGLNNDGSVKWANSHYKDAQFYSFLSALTPALDGGFILGGQEFSDTLGISLGIITKTDKNGQLAGCCNEPVEITVTPTPISIADQPFSSTNDSIINVVRPVTVSDFTLTDRPICAPKSYKIPDSTICTGGCLVVKLPKMPNGATATWSGSDQVTIEPFVGTDSVRICFNQVGDQPIQLQLQLFDGCTPAPYNSNILVKDTPIPLVFALSDSVFCPGGCTEILIENSATATFDFPGGVQTQASPPQICYQKEGKYSLKARQIQGGCLRTNAIEVNVQNLIDEVPNAFTPNNDQINDVFKPLLDCPPTDYLFRIFDRWGNLLFETTDYEAAWDGTFNNQPAPMDVYIWTVNSSNLQVSYKGDVTLIR